MATEVAFVCVVAGAFAVSPGSPLGAGEAARAALARVVAFDGWAGSSRDVAAGPGLGLRVWREHLVLRPDHPGRALCGRSAPQVVAMQRYP